MGIVIEKSLKQGPTSTKDITMELPKERDRNLP